MKDKLRTLGKEMYGAMMTGISYMIPVVISGAIIMALPNFWTGGGAADAKTGLAYYMYTWGDQLFKMMYYILAMFVAFGLAGRPALTSGLVVGLFAANGESGFLGAVVGGIIAGYVTKYTVKHLKLPPVMSSAKSILFIPIITSFIMFIAMQFAVDPACSFLMKLIYNFGVWVEGIGYKPLLLAVFGACFCFGMGGPFCYGMLPLALIYINAGDNVTAAATMVSATSGCLGTAIAVMLFKKKFTQNEKANVPGLFAGWICQITEFQIPFFMADLKTFTPAYILAGATGGFLVGLLGVTTPAWHGGMFTALMASSLPKIVLCILGQAAVVVLWVWLFKKDLPKEEQLEENTEIN
ncbi:fructose-specific PTS transporter subunit EIIC [uncultured Anaerofustis sp.]|uniref:fructose-specific PTS transporter subunit EIIC n=1 Tax=uncultured Anaerofustis sp. TaxID=904996 RepID=UPI0025D73E3F|nr:fructose-specific PTS transporter subunit EIIC [uncultured Anaerofustis sp.]